MGHIKKATTLVLFLLLLAVIGAYSLSTVYYQKAFTGLNDRILKQDIAIGDLKEVVAVMDANITGLRSQLSLQAMREENLSRQYTDIRSVKEQLSTEKQDLENQLAGTQKDLARSKEEILRLTDQISLLSYNYASLNKTLATVMDDVEDICDEIRGKVNVSDCKKYP